MNQNEIQEMIESFEYLDLVRLLIEKVSHLEAFDPTQNYDQYGLNYRKIMEIEDLHKRYAWEDRHYKTGYGKWLRYE